MPPQRQVNVRHYDQIYKEEDVVCGQANKTDSTPQQQTCPRFDVAAQEHHGAREAGGCTEDIDCKRQPYLSFLILKASAKLRILSKGLE